MSSTQGTHSTMSLDDEPIDEMPDNINCGPSREFSLSGPADVAEAWPVSLRVENRYFGQEWKAILESLRIHLLGGLGANRYVRWTLKDGFWGAIRIRPYLQRLVRQFDIDDIQPNLLFVEASQGGPWGDYILDILDDQRRSDAVFIQRFGKINAVPCECCERRYRRSDGVDEKRGLWPFHECISFAESNAGACGNCVFSIAGNACTYHGDDPRVAHFKAENLKEPVVSMMTPRSAPSLEPVLDYPTMAWLVGTRAVGRPTGSHRTDRVKERKDTAKWV
ncbi:hypothetical protein F4861DRAFT_548356 [Xylaria intraflava]|nr:hypothetical protein F4861DRAFT_548356 [Xylaria intraflava]